VENYKKVNKKGKYKQKEKSKTQNEASGRGTKHKRFI